MHSKRPGIHGTPSRQDLDLVLGAAQHLDIAEYQVFALAHRNWFGDLDPVAVERAFTAYLVGKVVPVWVRHFARLTLRRGVPPQALADAVAPPTPSPRQGVIAGGLVLGAVVLVVALAAAGNPPEGCFFPPCY